MRCSKCGSPGQDGQIFCGNCGVHVLHKRISRIKIYIALYGVLFFVLALLSRDSQWIYILGLEKTVLGTSGLQTRVVFDADNVMSIVYWVIMSFSVGVLVCVNKYWALSKIVVPAITIAFNVAPIVHISCFDWSVLFIIALIVTSIIEVKAVIKSWRMVAKDFTR